VLDRGWPRSVVRGEPAARSKAAVLKPGSVSRECREALPRLALLYCAALLVVDKPV